MSTTDADERREATTTSETPALTDYVILRKVDGANDAWEVVGEVTAHGARSAIKKHVDAGDPDAAEGSYVAVPERSWQPRTLTTATTKVQVWS